MTVTPFEWCFHIKDLIGLMRDCTVLIFLLYGLITMTGYINTQASLEFHEDI